MSGVILNRSAFNRTRSAVQWVESVNRSRPQPASRRRTIPPSGTVRLGTLDGALSAPASITATLPTATISRYTLDSSTGKLVDSGNNDTLSNPFPSLTAPAGAVVEYVPLEGLWVPAWVDCTEQDEQQTITITGSPTGGTFTLSYQGETTAALNHNSSAATVQSALETLSSIGSGNVSCSGGDLPGTAVVVTFQGTLENTDADPLMPDGSGLTGGTSPAVTVEETTKGCCG